MDNGQVFVDNMPRSCPANIADEGGQPCGSTRRNKNRRQFLLAAVGRPKAVPANSLLLWKESRGPGLVTLKEQYTALSRRVKRKIPQ
jgi:hypothetical protein